MSKIVWQPECVHCQKQCGPEKRQIVKPKKAPTHDGTCCRYVIDMGKPKRAKWVRYDLDPPIGPKYSRLSGFSTSESDFTPYYSKAFGRKVRTLKQHKALQKRHGTEDIGVTGDGAEKFVPRDIQRRTKRHAETADAIASGKPIERDGVSVSFTEGD